MSFGGFLDNSHGGDGGGSGGGGGGARIVADIPYNIRSGGPMSKSMFSSPGLSLALVSCTNTKK